MKIAITGSTWFIWRHLVEYFSRDHEVIAFGRKESPFNSLVSYRQWDIRMAYSGDIDCDIFIHVASDTGYEKSEKEMIETNVDSGIHILNLICRTQCIHFIYLSSSSVYMWMDGVLDEDAKIDIKNLWNSYAMSKYLAEVFFRDNLSKTVRYTILRPRAIYWEGDTTLLPKILERRLFWKLILIWDGEMSTSMTYIGHMNDAINLVIQRQQTNFEIYNISDLGISTYEHIYSQISNRYHCRGILHIPIFYIRFFSFFDPNRSSYLLDTFWKDKILNISKIQKLWYTPHMNIDPFLER